MLMVVRGYSLKTRWLGTACIAALLPVTGGAAEAFDPQADWLLGDWGGLRKELSESGIDFTFEYVGEAASNIDGGYNDNAVVRYTDQFSFKVDADLDKVLSLKGAKLHLAISNRSGNNLSADRISDPRASQLSLVQEVYGRGQTYRLSELSYEQSLFDERVAMKLGRFGVGAEFNTFACDFQNLALCGSQVGNWTDVWYNWPVSQLGARLQWNIDRHWHLKAGVIDQNPSELKPSNNFRLKGGSSAGMLLPVELIWKPKSGAAGLPGQYNIGFYHSTSDADDLRQDVNGNPQPLTGDSFRQRDGKSGWWAILQQQLTAVDGDSSRGLSVFATFTFQDKKTDRVDEFQQFGLTYDGPFNARPKDALGIGFGRIHINSRLRDTQRLNNEVNDVFDYDAAAYQPIQHVEYNAEFYYGFQLTPWLVARPNLQYVWQPGGVKEVDDAWVLGLKFALEL